MSWSDRVYDLMVCENREWVMYPLQPVMLLFQCQLHGEVLPVTDAITTLGWDNFLEKNAMGWSLGFSPN